MAVVVQGKYSFEVFGLQNANRALMKKLAKVGVLTKKAVIEGALIIQRQSQKNTPVDTGNLKAGHFTVWDGGGISQASFTGKDASKRVNDHSVAVPHVQAMVSKSKVLHEAIVGVSAEYGIFVHEDTEQSDGVKFLERAVQTSIPAVVAVAVREEKKL